MAVNNPTLTSEIKRNASYMNDILKKNPNDNIEITDPEFGNRLIIASYPVSILLNPFFRNYLSMTLKEQNINPKKVIPDEKVINHVTTILGSYMDGIREFPREDFQELENVCESFVACVNALEVSKKRKI
jgi:hypothetical protein